ncbi:baseplate assembly protein V [Escherichia coli]|nr:baseplate assembly protein V [Escherichia coli]
MSAELMRLLSKSSAPGSSLKLMRNPGACAFAAANWKQAGCAGTPRARVPSMCGCRHHQAKQVVIACIGGNPETAMIIGSLWSDASPAPGKSLKEIVVSAPDGAVFRYDADAGALSAAA